LQETDKNLTQVPHDVIDLLSKKKCPLFFFFYLNGLRIMVAGSSCVGKE